MHTHYTHNTHTIHTQYAGGPDDVEDDGDWRALLSLEEEDVLAWSSLETQEALEEPGYVCVCVCVCCALSLPSPLREPTWLLCCHGLAIAECMTLCVCVCVWVLLCRERWKRESLSRQWWNRKRKALKVMDVCSMPCIHIITPPISHTFTSANTSNTHTRIRVI